MKEAKVMIMDEQRLLRECLSLALSDDPRIQVLDVSVTRHDLASHLEKHAPDIFLLDVEAPDDASLGMTRTLSRQFGRVKIIVHGYGHEALQFIEAGAYGYLPKSATLLEFKEVLTMAARNEMVCSPELAYCMFCRLADLAARSRNLEYVDSISLTARQMEILRLIADGLDNRKIAESLNLSFHTVKNHIRNIFQRLDVSRRVEAVQHAYQKGWLTESYRHPMDRHMDAVGETRDGCVTFPATDIASSGEGHDGGSSLHP